MTDDTERECPKTFCDEEFDNGDDLAVHLRYQHGYNHRRAAERTNEVFA